MQTLLDRIVGGKEIVFVEEQPKKRMGSVTLGEIKIYFEGTGPRIQTDEGFQPFSYALGKVRDDAEYQRLDASLTETTRQLAELETGAPAAAQSLTHAEEAIPAAEKKVERSEESLEKAEQNHTEASKRMATCAREKDELCSSLVEIASRHDECAALLARRREVRRELAAAQQAIDSIAAVTPSADSLVADAEQRIRRGEAWEVRSDEARSALERARASAAEASTALRTGRENLKGAESELTSGNLDAAHRMIEAGKVAAQPAPAIVVRTHNEIAQARTAQETSEEKAAGAVREWVEKETAWNRLYAAMADKLRSTGVSIRGIAQAGALVNEVNNLLGVIGSDILTVVQSRTIPMPTQIEEVTQSVQKRLGSTADALEQLAGEVSEFSAYTPRLRDAAAQLTATQSSGKGNDRIERLASVIPAIRQFLTDLHQSNALVNIVTPGLSSLGTDYTADLDSIRSRFGDEYAAVTESSINARGCSDLVTLGGTTDPCTNRLKRVEQQIDIRKNARGHAFRDDFCAILSIREIQCMVEELRGK
jgi:chromosome segregation ATPase